MTDRPTADDRSRPKQADARRNANKTYSRNRKAKP
jgi:hypothetical protein